MTIVATDAIYIAEIDDATNLLGKTPADAAEADKAKADDPKISQS